MTKELKWKNKEHSEPNPLNDGSEILETDSDPEELSEDEN